MQLTAAIWFPALTLVVGFLIASVTEWWRDLRISKRAREARKEAIRERRIHFQRKTLLDLQEEMLKLIRTTGEMHRADNMAFRTTGAWQKQKIEENLDDRGFVANLQASKLGVRVRDELVRKLLEMVRSEAISTIDSRNPEDAECAIKNMQIASEKLNERIGELLRELDDEESPSERSEGEA